MSYPGSLGSCSCLGPDAPIMAMYHHQYHGWTPFDNSGTPDQYGSNMNTHQSYACVSGAYLTRYLRKREKHSTSGVADGVGACSRVDEDDDTISRYDGSVVTVNTDTHTNTWPDWINYITPEYVSHTVDANTTLHQKVTVEWRDLSNPTGTYWTEIYEYELYAANEYTAAQFAADCKLLYDSYTLEDMVDDASPFGYLYDSDSFQHIVYFDAAGNVLAAKGSSATQNGNAIGCGFGYCCSDVTYDDGLVLHRVDASYIVEYPFPFTTTPWFKAFKRVKMVDSTAGCENDYQLETGVDYKVLQASWTWPCGGAYGTPTCTDGGTPSTTFIGFETSAPTDPAAPGYVIAMPGTCP